MSSGWLWDDFEEPKAGPPSPPKRTKPKIVPGADAEHPLSITQLNTWIKRVLDEKIPGVWVEAEITDLAKPSSGHFYLTLKDSEAQIRAVLWRSTAARIPFQLKDGLTVLCYGNLDVYAPRGTYQFIIQRVQPVGIGPLQLAFQQLHAKLQNEGLFDPARKKPLPAFPKRVAFVTSPSGAAVHDFLEVLRRRWKGVHVVVVPVKVQGEGAAEEIATGLRLAARVQPRFDIIVVGRGGGSIEDLWAFNEEVLVRAVAACPIPTVSAVGHEIDVTLCDLAADVRALTPTEAAERILPNAEDLLGWLRLAHQRATVSAQQKWLMLQRRLESASSRPVLLRPQEMTRRLTQRIDELQLRLDKSIDHQLESFQHRLANLAASAEAMSPLLVLKRGYSLTRKVGSKNILTTPANIEVGDTIETRLHNGMLVSRVESISDVEPTSYAESL